jgi:hypothetical protein
MGIIDFRVRLRTKQLLKPWNPENPAPHFEQYIPLYKMWPRLTEMAVDELLGHMNKSGVEKGVVCGGGIEDNAHLIDLKKQWDKHFFFVAGIDPRNSINTNLREVERIKKEGLLGVNLSPFFYGFQANSKEYFPIYALCEEYKLIAIIHGSLHYDRHHPTWLSHPQYIDEVAIAFPKLKIVVSHGGNGFGNVSLAIAQRHPNMYLEYSAIWPRYTPEYFISAANSYLKNRCLFGTDYPLIEFEPAVKAWKDAIKPELHERFFEKNAMECLFGEPA